MNELTKQKIISMIFPTTLLFAVIIGIVDDYPIINTFPHIIVLTAAITFFIAVLAY